MLAASGGAQDATAGMAEPHPHRRLVPRSLPAPPPLPDNPKPTTRPRPRALTGRRGKGRAPTAPPASAPPPLPRCRRELAASAGEAPEPAPLSWRLPACASLPPLGEALCPPGAAASVWELLGASPRPRARAQGPSPTVLQGAPGRLLPSSQSLWQRAPAAYLPACLCLGVSGRRLAAWCFQGHSVHRGHGWGHCPVAEGFSVVSAQAVPRSGAGEHLYMTWGVSHQSPSQYTPLADKAL